MKFFYFLLLTCCYFNEGFTQQPSANWLQVIDAATSQPVEGATVRFFPGTETTVTNEQGKFHLKSESAIDSVQVSAIGFKNKSVYQTTLNQQDAIKLEIQPIEIKNITLFSGVEGTKTISMIDIKNRSFNHSQEVLSFIPGLFIGQHAGGGKAEQIFLRGFDIDHGTDVAITVDGMPVNMVSHAHGQGYADLHFLMPELIDKVDYKKGTYSADKGNMATAGFVNFHTKKVLTENSIKLEAGQFNTYRLAGMMKLLGAKAAQKQQSAYIATEYMYSDGYFDNPQDFKRFNVFGKYHGRLNSSNILSFTASAFSSSWSASGQIPERAFKDGLISFFGAIDPNEGGETGRRNINTQHIKTFDNGATFQNQLYYTHYDFALYSNFTFFLKDSIHGDQIKQKEVRNLVGYNGSYQVNSFAGDNKITTEIGGGFRLDKTKNSELSRTKNKSELLQQLQSGNISEINPAVYINETIRWNEKFTINAGLRWDYFDMQYQDKTDNNKKLASSSIISPKFNIYYHINSKTNLYLNTGKGFHSNDTRVAVVTSARKAVPAAYGTDLGFTTKPFKNLFFNTAVWYLELDQEFIYVGDEGVVEPSGRSRRIGIDASARYQPFTQLIIDADVNYSHARSVEEIKGENYLPLAPAFTSTGGLSYKTTKGWNGSLRYRFLGRRPANEDYSTIARGYFIADANLMYARNKWEAGISAQNLLNTRWKETQFDTESRLKDETVAVSEIHFTPGTPFFIKFSLTYKF